MITYNDLYEVLRKEKYNEQLQVLPKEFVKEVAIFFEEQKRQSSTESTTFFEGLPKAKKQLENSVALFRELIVRRKKKLLNLVFVATETGILKRDYENMLTHEKDIFDQFIKIFENGDKQIAHALQSEPADNASENSMIIFSQNTEQFVDMQGNVVGPFSAGELANLDNSVSQLLVSSGKARYVDGG
ncbi:hypothetical protein J4461_03625 [Candidatus Pacearchaeota archaeon]|nr:hypothetical protein [uncultured archaeon]AQS34035.1 hypothetical protein [uncultured archaeon]AQS34084.1 hypothetical protein [uncultured archaeon]MBS3089941.1 hypothetical protein [Candidatus Pacearchaeota archaeon]